MKGVLAAPCENLSRPPSFVSIALRSPLNTFQRYCAEHSPAQYLLLVWQSVLFGRQFSAQTWDVLASALACCCKPGMSAFASCLPGLTRKCSAWDPRESSHFRHSVPSCPGSGEMAPYASV